MVPQRIQFTEANLCQWAGMGDFLLVSPDGQHIVELIYEGEPPHGDSFHKVAIDGRAYPGYVWGCMFAFSSCSRYLALSAMPTKYERRTAIVDLHSKRHFILPEFIYQVSIRWPTVVGEKWSSESKSYKFDGNEQWLAY
jgi:hypothetical protein